MNGLGKTFFRRYPWLKFGIPLAVATVTVLGFLGWWTFVAEEREEIIVLAPFSEHVRVPDYSGKLVALTFDDGPSPATTPRLLEVLKEKNATATFFELGTLARNNPDLVRQVAANGNEVASHTMYHQNFSRMSTSAISSDIAAANAVFYEILGKYPSLVRTPYGINNAAARSAANAPIILWTVDTLDWKNKNAAMVRDEAIGSAFDGAIILMHDIHPTTVDAVAEIIDGLRANGYELVTVSQLAKLRGVTLNSGEAYGSFRP